MFVLFRIVMQHSCSRGCQHVDETSVGQWNLYTKIDTYNLQCYNEKHDGSGKDVFRAWEERLDRSKVAAIKRRMLIAVLLIRVRLWKVTTIPNYSSVFHSMAGWNSRGCVWSARMIHLTRTWWNCKWFENFKPCLARGFGPSRWSNLPELRFENARGKAHQEIPLTYDPSGTLAYQIK